MQSGEKAYKDFLWELISYLRDEKNKAINDMRTWNEMESFYASGKRNTCEVLSNKIEDFLKKVS